MNKNELGEWHYFSSAVYTIKKPEFLDKVNSISKEYIDIRKKSQVLNEIYSVYMSDNMFQDNRLSEFTDFIISTSHDILNSQGYKMDSFDMRFHDMWAQEHYKYSGQEEHIHGFGSQISGFYFLEVPSDPPRVLIHDPRPSKIYANMPESDMNKASYASQLINFLPESGMMFFTNSWLPHSFTKNTSDSPFRFIHFDLGVTFKQNNKAIVV